MWLGGQVSVSACSYLNFMETPGSGDRGGHQQFLDHTAVLHSWALAEHMTSCRLTALNFLLLYGLQAGSSYMLCANMMWGRKERKTKGNQPVPKWNRKGSPKKELCSRMPCTVPSAFFKASSHGSSRCPSPSSPGRQQKWQVLSTTPKLVLKWKVCQIIS